MDVIGLGVIILVLFVVYWAVHYIAGATGAPPLILVFVDVILALVGVVALLRWAGLGRYVGV